MQRVRVSLLWATGPSRLLDGHPVCWTATCAGRGIDQRISWERFGSYYHPRLRKVWSECRSLIHAHSVVMWHTLGSFRRKLFLLWSLRKRITHGKCAEGGRSEQSRRRRTRTKRQKMCRRVTISHVQQTDHSSTTIDKPFSLVDKRARWTHTFPHLLRPPTDPNTKHGGEHAKHRPGKEA